MKDQRSTTSDEIPVTYGPEYWAHFLDDLDEDDFGGEGQHLISVDELRAAGALDVPAAWRKSLGNESHYTLPGFEDDDQGSEDVEQDAESQSAASLVLRQTELSTENGAD